MHSRPTTTILRRSGAGRTSTAAIAFSSSDVLRLTLSISGISASVQSAAPYSETIGEDVYHNARGNARRAGVGRNTLQGSAFAELDLRVSRDLGFASGTSHARMLSVSVDTFNVLNRINYGTYIGTLGSPLFGQPTTARAPRQLQLSAHLKF